MSLSTPRCKNLVLDAGPLLSLSPLRGLAETYYTVPQVLDELKDKRARQHFEQLGLSAGIRIEVKTPDAASLYHVIQFAKKTGDYSVLSHADLCVLALTYSLQERSKAMSPADDQGSTSAAPSPSQTQPSEDHLASPQDTDVNEVSDSIEGLTLQEESSQAHVNGDPIANDKPDDALKPRDDRHEMLRSADAEEKKEIDSPMKLENVAPSDSDLAGPSSAPVTSSKSMPSSSQVPIFEDPSDDDDGEGEWITPSNVALHKSRALNLLPEANASRRKDEVIDTGCMTTDFAMQNVLLHMGLNLIDVEGKRIERLKTSVLRCHACFKICKDNSKKFCPSCGNPTLLRASVTVSSPNASSEAPVMQVHLKSNYQYRIRGTKYSIPTPKPGSTKAGTGEGLILREDQTEWLRAKKRLDGKREREEQKLLKGLIAKGAEGGVSVGSWMDPDWIPEIMSTGPGGKGRNQKVGGRDGDMPVIGYGRKNPNERRRK